MVHKMCNSKENGGLRCSSHARAALSKASRNLQKIECVQTRKAFEKARVNFYLTPSGLKELRGNGQSLLADIFEAERKQILTTVKAAEGSGKPLPTVVEQEHQPAVVRSFEDCMTIYDNGSMEDVLALIDDEDTPQEMLEIISLDGIEKLNVASASSPRSTPEMLRSLSYRIDKDVHAALIQNPNTPADVVSRLKTALGR